MCLAIAIHTNCHWGVFGKGIEGVLLYCFICRQYFLEVLDEEGVAGGCGLSLRDAGWW